MIRVFVSHEPTALEIFFGDGPIRELKHFAEVRLNQHGRVLTTDMLRDAAANCDAVILDRNTAADGAFFADCADIVSVHCSAVDIRTIDVEAASRAGVLVTHASATFVDAVVELALGMMIDLARSVSSYVIDYRRGEPPPVALGTQLSGSTIGIIGYGRIGRRLAEVADALGMTVLATDPHQTIDAPHVEQTGLRDLLGRSDFVHCLAVATPETENLMNQETFAAMKAGACFLNLSRGDLVDETALQAALKSGHIAGAALDVGRAEDQKPSPALAALPNVIATPHIGGQTPTALRAQAFETVEQVRAVARRVMPPNAVNPDRAKRFAEWVTRS